MRSAGSRLLFGFAILALAWAAAAWTFGGLSFHVFGTTLRTHDAQRPLALAALALAACAALERHALIGAIRRPADAAAWVAPRAALLLAFVTSLDAIHYGSFVAAGSDSYGYLSEAYGWANGPLPRPLPIPLALPFDSSDLLQAPLGYTPGRTSQTLVPTCAPGLPLMMAAAILVADPVGPYAIVPIAAGLFVWLTFVLARRMASPSLALVAALLAATSPVVLFLSLWVMSDLPAGVLWTAATIAVLGKSKHAAIAAALCIAAAILVRPNLFPLALLLLYAAARSPRAEGWRRAVPILSLAVVAALSIAVLYSGWYGSATRSGYGRTTDLFGLQNVLPNARNYASWLIESQSAWLGVALLSLPALTRTSARRDAVLLAWSVWLVTVLCYVGYLVFDTWWYLRFLIPGLGALFALVAVALDEIVERLPRPWGAAAALACAMALVWHAVAYTAALDMFGPFQTSEYKYVEVGDFIARRMTTDAVFFAMQHSGTIRYYGGRHTLRYDRVTPAMSARLLADLEARGLHPYLAIEDAEIADARKAFGIAAGRPLPWPPVARMDRFGGTTVFDLSSRGDATGPVPIDQSFTLRARRPRPVRIEPRTR